MNNTISGRTPEELKKALECSVKKCCIYESCSYYGIEDLVVCLEASRKDALVYIEQLEKDKKHLQERICNQRRQLRLLHLMYDWALGILQRANLNDRAKFQRYLLDRGIDQITLEDAGFCVGAER